MAFAGDHTRRERALEQLAAVLRGERDQAIRTAYRDGLPMSDIATILEMSHQRVSQIIRS